MDYKELRGKNLAQKSWEEAREKNSIITPLDKFLDDNYGVEPEEQYEHPKPKLPEDFGLSRHSGGYNKRNLYSKQNSK